MRVTGKIIDTTVDYKTGKPRLLLEVNEQSGFEILADEFSGKEKLSVEIKPYREKRSLDANAYFFVLADRLAEKLGLTKEEVYRNAVRGIGGASEVVCVQNDAVARVCDGWEKNGLGWQTEVFPSRIAGCTNVILYYGSSTYDREQMSRLIDHIVQDCRAVGVETRTPQELANLLSLWGETETEKIK